MLFFRELEKKLPYKDKDLGGLVIYPKKITFGLIKSEGIYCCPFVMAMRKGANYSEYIEIVRNIHNSIIVSDVCICIFC
jgi:hypothetical protein